MLFCHLKKEQVCYFSDCGSVMQVGEEAVITRIKASNGVTYPHAFHPQCFLDWNEGMFEYRLEKWRADNPPPKKKPIMGRPRKYRDYLKAGRLQSLLHYHRKKGNQDKVQELGHELSKLEIRREHESSNMPSL
jgi:hypothetical protein